MCDSTMHPVGPQTAIHPTSITHPPESVVCPPSTAPTGGEPSGEAAPQSTSLDTKETSVRGDFDRFMAEKGSVEERQRDPVLDEDSASARFRHAGWRTWRRRVWESLNRTGQSASRRRAFGECGTYGWLEASRVKTGAYRCRWNCCRDRMCTPCAVRRSAVLARSLRHLIGDATPTFVTLTLRGMGEKLTDLIDKLYRCFRALRQHPFWAEACTAGAAFLEIKYDDRHQRWHPHLHIMCIARYMEQGFLSKIWHTLTKDSHIVDIRKVSDTAKVAGYVTKYVSKPLNTSFGNAPALLDEAIQALAGRRLCLCFGDWYGEPLGEDGLEFDDDDSAPGDWTFFSDLETVLARARSGERDAITILTAAGMESRWRMSLTDSS